MSLLQLIKNKNKRLNSIPDKFLSSVEKAQIKIYDEIVDLIAELETKNGKFIPNKKNLDIVSTITSDLRKVLLKGEYADAVKEFAKQFVEQFKINNEYLKQAFPEYKTTEFTKTANKTIQANVVRSLVDAPIDANFILPIQKILIESVANGYGFSKTLKSIRAAATGNSKLLRYAKQISTDSFSIADRTQTKIAADQLGVDWFLYSGGEIKTTRCFCEERTERYFHRKEIEDWGRGQNIGECETENGTWAGRNPVTDAVSIFTLAGGFNCRHSIMPVSITLVDKKDVVRNINSGNFSPSKSEKKLYKL